MVTSFGLLLVRRLNRFFKFIFINFKITPLQVINDFKLVNGAESFLRKLLKGLNLKSPHRETITFFRARQETSRVFDAIYAVQYQRDTN